MAFLFDTNIFIASKNSMPIDLWPTFWTRMSQMINSGQVFSIEMVKDEISKGKDELVEWIKQNAPKEFFIKIDAGIINKFSETQRWASSMNFTRAALETFASVADSYLIATAAAKELVVVTYEKSSPGAKKRVMIPDACAAVGVRCCDLNTVIRQMGILI